MVSAVVQNVRGDIHGYAFYYYSNPSFHHKHITKHFGIFDNGNKVRWYDQPGSTLLQLHHDVQRTIYEEVRATVCHFDSWSHNDMAIKMTTQEATTIFKKFEALQRLSEISAFKKITQTGYTKASPTELVLDFELATSITFDGIRIDVSKVLHLLRDFSGSCFMTLSGCHDEPESKVRVDWPMLQRPVFLLLSDILEQLPSNV
ncbi:hypothetical protein EJ02DRAFT_84587 [Clathrospora elynae]|uniref:Uncharacterized protein n=1 Tax=Clathrospora elynae TaxID=706981 RepID=A0A6A5SWM3_9PLEO|nr:hypothetical protein EJ02DRAFT_84587 [Clathrospora elynae]